MAKSKLEQKSDDNLIEEAIENIRRDRSQAQLLLSKLLEYMLKNEQHHKEVGFTAAKYLETLQRSNEQLVKLVQISQKNGISSNLSEDEKEDLFDVINEQDQEEED